MRKVIVYLLFFIVFASSASAKQKRYIYTLIPMKTPYVYIKGQKAVVASNNIAVSVKQVKFPFFAKTYKAFKREPNVSFIYLEFTIKNRTKSNVEMDINFISLESNKEYRKPLNYDQMYSMIKQIYPESTPEIVLQQCLLDFISPIKPGEKKSGILIFRNFSEKAKNAVLKIDNLTVNNIPLSLKIPYNLQRRKIVLE